MSWTHWFWACWFRCTDLMVRSQYRTARAAPKDRHCLLRAGTEAFATSPTRDAV